MDPPAGLGDSIRDAALQAEMQFGQKMTNSDLLRLVDQRVQQGGLDSEELAEMYERLLRQEIKRKGMDIDVGPGAPRTRPGGDDFGSPRKRRKGNQEAEDFWGAVHDSYGTGFPQPQK